MVQCGCVDRLDLEVDSAGYTKFGNKPTLSSRNHSIYDRGKLGHVFVTNTVHG